MANVKTRTITLIPSKDAFSMLWEIPKAIAPLPSSWKRSETSKTTENLDFSGIALLRKLLSNERARMLYTIKHQKPVSLYKLAKLLGRDFKSVFDDAKLLERFGFIELIAEKAGKRERFKPVIAIETLKIDINI
jgi:predicted transcriptional regulator